MQLEPIGLPIAQIARDILGTLPESYNKNKYILVISDYFTKWTEAFPMANMEAKTIVSLLVEEVITRSIVYSLRSYIHSDQGRQYESMLFGEVCNLLGIYKTRTTPFHRKSDGIVEQFTQLLATMLTAYVSEHQNDCDSHLPYIMMAYGSAEHESTWYTPKHADAWP
jgi:hypothetical protein